MSVIGSFQSYSHLDLVSFPFCSLLVKSFQPDFRGGSFQPNFGGSLRHTLFLAVLVGNKVFLASPIFLCSFNR